MKLDLAHRNINAISLEEIHMMSSANSCMTAALSRENEVSIFRESFRTEGGSSSALVAKYTSGSRFTKLLSALSDLDFPIIKDPAGEDGEDEFYTLEEDPPIHDAGSFVLLFRCRGKDVLVKGWLKHPVYREIRGTLEEYFPEFKELS